MMKRKGGIIPYNSEEKSNICNENMVGSCSISPTATIVNNQRKSVRIREMVQTDYPPRCYYCNSKPNSTKDYETHVVMKHSLANTINLKEVE